MQLTPMFVMFMYTNSGLLVIELKLIFKKILSRRQTRKKKLLLHFIVYTENFEVPYFLE